MPEMPLRRGAHKEMEDIADGLLRASLAGVTKHSDKSDILTPWKEADRRKREVYVPTGTPDASLRRGIISRVANITSPHLNAVQSGRPSRRTSTGWNDE